MGITGELRGVRESYRIETHRSTMRMPTPHFCTNHRYWLHAISAWAGHSAATLIEAYIDALLVNEELADLVGEALDSGEIDSQRAHTAWLLIAPGQEDYLA